MGETMRRDLYDGVLKISTPLELNVPPAGSAVWWYAWRRGRSRSDGIVSSLFCRPAAADRASDGNGRQTYFWRRSTSLA